jgi:DNA polymerase-3 subunit beta
VPSNILKRAIQKTVFACSTDELRPSLTGLFFNFGLSGVTVVATNGHKLMKVDAIFSDLPDISFLVPKKSAEVLASVLPDDQDTMIQYSKNKVRFSSDTGYVEITLLDERYVDYSNAIRHPDKHMLIHRQEFLDALRRCLIIFSVNQEKTIRITIQTEQIHVMAVDSTMAREGNEVLALVERSEMTDFTFGISPDCLVEILRHLDEEVLKFSFKSPNQAIHITSENSDTFALIMPHFIPNN